MAEGKRASHSGHRVRLRRRIGRYGVGSLEDHELLEFLLFYVIRRRDTNPLAHDLIEHFGSLDGVLSADQEELESFGVTRRVAFWLSHLSDYSEYFIRFYKHGGCPPENISGDMISEVRRACKNVPSGRMLVICISVSGNITGTEFFEYETDLPEINLRNVCNAAATHEAHYAVIANTYPIGISAPTEYDLYMTEKFFSALESIDVTLLDRYHVTPHNCISYKEKDAFFTSCEELENSMYFKIMKLGSSPSD